MDQNLSTQEEYARSGHTASDVNSNTEGYIESIPAMNAPVDKALAGYRGPDAHCIPYSFECLGTRIIHAVKKLIEKLFCNDVSVLKEDDLLYIVVLLCGACLACSYNHLVIDVKHPDKNEIIVKIREAAMAAKIDDPSVPQVARSPHWLVVLKYWSRQTTDAFVKNNPERVSQNASLNQQFFGVGVEL